jgi:hypothetical protein
MPIIPISKSFQYHHHIPKSNENNKNIEISSDSKNDHNDYDTIDYWHDLQLTKANECILLDSNKWLRHQHLGTIMQILYVGKLQ